MKTITKKNNQLKKRLFDDLENLPDISLRELFMHLRTVRRLKLIATKK